MSGQTVAVICLGIMGQAIAKNLLAGGLRVNGFAIEEGFGGHDAAAVRAVLDRRAGVVHPSQLKVGPAEAGLAGGVAGNSLFPIER